MVLRMAESPMQWTSGLVAETRAERADAGQAEPTWLESAEVSTDCRTDTVFGVAPENEKTPFSNQTAHSSLWPQSDY